MNMHEQDFPQLSIIIVNYNGKRFLDACLESVAQHVACSHEVIIVDNNSHDGSGDHIPRQWPRVKLLACTENLGFARGNNRGAESARGRYLLLLNNDTTILAPIQPLVDHLESNPETAIAGGCLRNPDGSIQPSVGYDHTPLRLLFSWMVPRTFHHLSTWQLFERRPGFYRNSHPSVHWVSGALLCIRRETWINLGGFDRNIFMYVEDVDLCRRARQAGEKVAYIAAADTCHFEGGGKKGMSEHALLATVDSYCLLLDKQYGSLIRTATCIALSGVFLVRSCLYWLVSILTRDPLNGEKAGFYLSGSRRLLFGPEARN